MERSTSARPGYGSLGYDGCGGWNILQARYALCLLFEYAATLGLIDVAYRPSRQAPGRTTPTSGGPIDLEYLSRYDGLQYLRLTPLGAWCLGVAETYEPPRIEAAPVFTILANLELAVTGKRAHARRPARARAVRRADLPTASGGWIATSCWRRSSTATASPDVREFLAARAVTPIPAERDRACSTRSPNEASASSTAGRCG